MTGDTGPRAGHLLKAWVPRPLRRLLIATFVDRFRPAALRRFQQAHRPRVPLARDDLARVAVVMPCYNHAAYLEATLDSLARQTYRPFEVVAVDDQSSDDTWHELQRLLPQLPAGIHPRLLQTTSNSGQAHAINFGIRESPATVFMVLNDDDYLVYDALEAALELLRRNSEVFLLGATSVPLAGRARPAADDPRLCIRCRFPDYTAIPLTRYLPADTVQLKRHDQLNMTHSSMCFCRSAWQTAGGYYPEKGRRVVAYSDRDFQLRVASLFPIAVAHDVPFVFWRSDSSVDRGRNS